jgi:hypothetical protein
VFPEIEIQPKGLIATEAFVCYPLLDEPGAALALRSHLRLGRPLAGGGLEPDAVSSSTCGGEAS